MMIMTREVGIDKLKVVSGAGLPCCALALCSLSAVYPIVVKCLGAVCQELAMARTGRVVRVVSGDRLCVKDEDALGFKAE